MMTNVAGIIGAVGILTALSGLASIETGAAKTVKLAGVQGEVDLVVHLPPRFDADKTYSVLVSPGDFYWQDRPSQPGWIVVTSDAFWGSDRLENGRRALAKLRQEYKIRGGGFHIAGWSANSAGIFEIAMAFPQDFLSVTGVAGMPGAGAEGRLSQLEDVRVQLIVGENDTYWREGSERWHEKLQKAGVAATLEIVPNGDHVMPELANEPFFERMNRLVKAAAT